jgi:succinoglycan biosynthesis protein ExoA
MNIAVHQNAPLPISTQTRHAASPPGRVIIIIPTLNEARHIVMVIRSLHAGAQRIGAHIVVVDGGSTDGTPELVRAEAARQGGTILLHNPRRLQAAAINLAVADYADQIDWIIRVDAHAGYPPHYCDILLDEARRTHADSVVVRMHAVGNTFVQRNITAAQNALFGNGGSLHRGDGQGRFVDHGHHALMRVAAFVAVGGYDESFTHNEDAELDQRLTKAGFRIWLTGTTRMDYVPRDSLSALARQYYSFGAGRCATAWKHPASIRARHLILIGLAPIGLMALLSVASVIFALPFALWVVTCLSAGVLAATRAGAPALLLSGVAGAVMQMAWSLGFWGRLLANSRAGLRRQIAAARAGPTTLGEDL